MAEPLFRGHPVIFSILVVPYGAVGGYATVALAFLATKNGLTVRDGAELVALSYVPQIWKFFWAPVADATLTRHSWYWIATSCSAICLFAQTLLPLGTSTLTLVEALVLLSSFASTFVCFSVEGMIAHLTPPEGRGRVSGWYQAGNLGGNGIGGGLGLWLLTELPHGWETGLILAASLMACALALRFVPKIPADKVGASPFAMARNTTVELWKLALSRDGIMCALLCFIPIGTGSASAVLAQSEVASVWNVGAHTVELIQGFLGGAVSMVGCVVAGYGCKRWGGRNAYAIYGGLMAAVTLTMSVLPETPAVYVTLCLTYQFVNGFCYAAFSAFVLDAIGSRLAATKYNAFASLSNTPIWYMGLILAAFETKFGPRGMLITESAFGVAGIILFLAVEFAWRSRPKDLVPEPVPQP